MYFADELEMLDRKQALDRRTDRNRMHDLIAMYELQQADEMPGILPADIDRDAAYITGND